MMALRCLAAVIALVLITTPSFASNVTFTGDARARIILRDDTLFGNEPGSLDETYDSRVRLVINAKAPGGAYARARLRMDRRWGVSLGDEGVLRTTSDIAYLGIPIGPAVLVAGAMKNDVTRFFEWDQAADQVFLQWDMFDTKWRASFRMNDEGQEAFFDINRLEDNDNVVWGLIASRQINDWLYGQANYFYADDQRDTTVTGEFIEPATGSFWSIFFNGVLRDIEFEAEVAYKAGNVRQSRNETGEVINLDNVNRGDGWGWYAEGTYSFDSFDLTLNTGMAISGYEADNDFGWILLGNSNNEPISVIGKLGANGDWFWIGTTLDWQPHERLRAIGHIVWVYVDAVTVDDDSILQYRRLFEVSADLAWKISEGTALTWKLGFLRPDLKGFYEGEEVQEDVTFATYLRLQVNF